MPLNKSSLLGLEQQHYQRQYSGGSAFNFRPLNLPSGSSTEYTFVDNLQAGSFSAVMMYLASGRDWYRSLQHHLEVRSEIQGKLAAHIDRAKSDVLSLQSIKEVCISASGADAGEAKSLGGTRSHMQLWHSLRSCFGGWQHALASSSTQLGVLAVRVRHLKRELKGTVGMVQSRSKELAVQLRQAQQAPVRAAKRCHEMETRLAELEQRYARLRERKNAAKRLKHGAFSTLENTVLNFRNKTETARQRVVHAQTERRVMRTKYDQCLLQLLQLTEQKFLQFYIEMKLEHRYVKLCVVKYHTLLIEEFLHLFFCTFV